MHPKLESIVEKISEANGDMEEALKGGGAAGTRVRRHLQDARKMIKDVRVLVLEIRKKARAKVKAKAKPSNGSKKTVRVVKN